jgi:hypothetical protein
VDDQSGCLERGVVHVVGWSCGVVDSLELKAFEWLVSGQECLWISENFVEDLDQWYDSIVSCVVRILDGVKEIVQL